MEGSWKLSHSGSGKEDRTNLNGRKTLYQDQAIVSKVRIGRQGSGVKFTSLPTA